MQSSSQPAAVAYLLRTNNRRLQAYCQHHPFLTGPDEGLNTDGLALLRAGPHVRKPTDPVQINLLEPLDYKPPEKVVCRVREMVAAIGHDIRNAPSLIDDYYWKVAVTPGAPTNILSIGCGGGEELIVLRALNPQARIMALDWETRLPPLLASVTQVEFRRTDLLERLEMSGRFDLIFSNHTLEHFYDPDFMLERLAEYLHEGGVLVSALPLDGDESDVFRSRLREWARQPSVAHWFDAGWLDPGHPWKTNASDVAETLKKVGFLDVTLYQRAEHLTRKLAMGELALVRYRRLGGLTNTAWRALCRIATGVIGALAFGQSLQMFRKIMLGLDYRIPWGANRLKNTQAKELVFVAKRAAKSPDET